jgi:hypothetical protein
VPRGRPRPAVPCRRLAGPRGGVADAVGTVGAMAAVERLVAWRGPDPDRIDVARVVLRDDRLSARGTSCAADHSVAWRLDTGPGWTTRALDVHSLADDGDRRLVLRRDDTGRWTARRWVDGRPADAELPDLTDAADCDLGLCPLTNTMPVLRSGLLDRPGVVARFTTAWVAVPELVVHASVQDYGPAVRLDDGGAVVPFSGEGFTADITVDADGLVVTYPGIAQRVVG